MPDVKQIQDYPKHYVSSCGEVYVRKGERHVLLQPFQNGRGYLQVSLWDADRYKNVNFLVHRLVAGAFIPNPDNLPQVNHKNGVTGDNSSSNLEWCSGEQNMAHAVFIGKTKAKQGSGNWSAVLTEQNVLDIRARHASGVAKSVLAREYKVSTACIRAVVRRITWDHVA